MKCEECGEEFVPNRPWRKICFKIECKKSRAAKIVRKSRAKNGYKPTTLRDKERHGKEFENAKKRNMFLLSGVNQK